MTTNKADNKAARKANETALKNFPKAKLRKALDDMAASKDAIGKAKDAGSGASLAFVMAAHAFSAENSEADIATRVTGWRENLAALVLTLATEGHPLAELKPGKDDKPATAKLTGTGNNVASIAKGVIEFDISPEADCLNDDGELGYRGVREKVETMRAEQRRERDPDAAALADAKAACDEQWKEYRSKVFETGDAGLIDSLKLALADMLADFEDEMAKAAEVEAEAEAEAEAA